MHILKISDVYFPRINGVSTSIRTFSHELIRQGHQVTLITPEYATSADEEPFNIVRIPSYYIPLDPEDRCMKPRAITRQLAQLKQQKFDVLHIHTPFVAHHQGLKLAKQLNIPIVETYHTYFEEYLDKYFPWLSRTILRYVARHFSRNQCEKVDQIIVPTLPMLDVLRSYGIKNQITVIPTGIPEGLFTQGDGCKFRQRFGIAADRAVICYVGRIAHEKNIDFLIEMTHRVRQEIPDILFVIVGEGPALHALQKSVQKQNLESHVKFIGYLSRQHELPNCYAAADVFVFASNTETQGLVLLEAMQAGTPVVSTAAMGTAEVLKNQKGGLVAQEDVGHFGASVIKLLSHSELRQKCAKEAIENAAEWSVTATTQHLIHVYESLVSHQDCKKS